MRLKLRYWRRRRALSIPDLAALAHASSETIVRIETTNHVPRPNVIRRLAAALEVSLDELLVVEDETEEPERLEKVG
jgi:transcriptional regulator with XRE-family HTH domain